MKKLQKFALILLAGSLVFATACGDDDEDDDPELTAEQKLSGNSFLLTDQIIIENGATVSTFDSLDACDRDDVIIFNSNKTGSFDEGLTKCDPSDPQGEAFIWSLPSESTLRVISSGDTTDARIVTNDGTNLKLNVNFTDNTNTTDVTLTYRKQ